MPPNSRIFLNGFLRLKLFNNPFVSCSLINRDFLLPHKAHFDDDSIAPPLLVFNTFISTFFVFFYCTSNDMATCFIINCVQSYPKQFFSFTFVLKIFSF